MGSKKIQRLEKQVEPDLRAGSERARRSRSTRQDGGHEKKDAI